MPVWTQVLVPELQIDESLSFLFYLVKVFRIVRYEDPVPEPERAVIAGLPVPAAAAPG